MRLRIFNRDWELLYTWENSPFSDGHQPDILRVKGKLFNQIGISKIISNESSDIYLTYVESEVQTVDPEVLIHAKAQES